MELLDVSDTTSLSYWLNWRFFLCALWVIIAMIMAAFIISKYEYSEYLESDSEGMPENAKFWCADEARRPCVKEIHPIWLMAFRNFAFCVILTALVIDFVSGWKHAVILFTVDLHFGDHLFWAVNGVTREKDPDYHYVFRTALKWSHAFQILFQMTYGAVILTDSVYWCIIFSFLTVHDNQLSMLTVIEHSLNAILLLGDTALNGLWFPWFRISYFILLTCVYVSFEWIVHASVSLWWPYPILDLSLPYAPLWYLCVALLHLPCYALFQLIVKTKHSHSLWCNRDLRC